MSLIGNLARAVVGDHQAPSPDSVRTATGSPATLPRRESDSPPTPSPAGKPQAASKRRRPPGGKASKPRRVRIERWSAIVGTATGRHSGRQHAAHLLDCLRASGFQPGDMIMARTMQSIYRSMCADLDWHELPWGGADGIGRHLRELVGGKKTYRDVYAGGRTYSNERVYILPPWPPSHDVGNVAPIGARTGRRTAA